ncbi:MAG: sulfur oxidation c-type cytochrome SoxX, partial [Polaromonas sp.]|nr:sulfur oxidation c-type cytochrome SoxX [Polaromonas sp.]
MMKKICKQAVLVAATVLLASCATAPSPQDVAEATQKVLKSSFRDQGIAKTSWLDQDASNKACSESQGAALDEKLAKAIEEANLKTVKMPSDGKFIGDWKEGEKIAQNGRGMTWSDAAGSANGGSCYNCHQ